MGGCTSIGVTDGYVDETLVRGRVTEQENYNSPVMSFYPVENHHNSHQYVDEIQLIEHDFA